MTSDGPMLARTGGVQSPQAETHGLSPPEPGLVSCPHHHVTAVFTCRDLGGYLFTRHLSSSPFLPGTTTEFCPNRVSDGPGSGFPMGLLEIL